MVRYDFSEKELVTVTKLREVIELNRDIKDKRDKDLGVDFSTEAYKGGEEVEELTNKAINKGIVI